MYSEQKELVREIVAHDKDSVFRYSFFYDDFSNKVVENKYYVNANNVSLPLLRTEWVYEANNCVSQRQQKWYNGDWKTFYLIESSYIDGLQQNEKHSAVMNSIELVQKTILYQYQGDKLQSIKNYQGTVSPEQLTKSEIYVYDDSNRLKAIQIDGLSTYGVSLKQLFDYVYDASGKLKSLLYSDIQNGTLTGKQLTLFFYDDAGKLVSQTQKIYSDLTSKWESKTKSEFVYNTNGQLIQEIYSHYSGAYWIPNIRYEYVYDSQDLLQSKIMYQSLYRQWRKMYTIEYSQIENNQPNLMESKYNFWGGNSGEYVNNFIPFYFNDEISIMEANRMELKYTTDLTVLTNASSGNNGLKIYPNPSNGVFYVNTQTHYIESWEVFDLHGMKIKSETNHFRTGIIDLTEFSDGMYLIKAFTNDNKQLKQKIIIQRNQ